MKHTVTKKVALKEMGLCYCHPSEKPAQEEHNQKLVDLIFGDRESIDRFEYDDLYEKREILTSIDFE